jgi:hypothetical protein
MTHRLILALALTVLISCFTSCGNSSYNTLNPKSDTTEAFRILIDSALNNQLIPDFKRLHNRGFFGDTFFFKFDKRLVRNLPVGFKYKLLSEGEICSLATEYFKVANDAFNYIELTDFSKNDSIYVTIFTNRCLTVYQNDYEAGQNKTIKCEYEKYCNGGMYMRFSIQSGLLKPLYMNTVTW